MPEREAHVLLVTMMGGQSAVAIGRQTRAVCGIGIPADELWHQEAKTWCGGGRGRGGSALWHRPRSLAFCVVLGAVSVTWSCSTVVFLVLIFATTRQHMGRSSDDKTVVSMPDYVLEGNNSHNMCVTHRRIRRNENGVPQSSGAVPSKRGFLHSTTKKGPELRASVSPELFPKHWIVLYSSRLEVWASAGLRSDRMHVRSAELMEEVRSILTSGRTFVNIV